MQGWTTHLLWSDTQVPDHHVRANNNLVAFIADYRPGSIVHVGDFLDMKGPARWSKGYAAEYESNLQDDADKGVKLLGMVREVYDGPFGIHKGNHDARIETYLEKYAPALRSLRGLDYAGLLDFKTLEIEALPVFYDIAPGWVTTHLDVTSVKPTGGMTALSLARKIRKSVIGGHTHRAAIVSHTDGMGSTVKTLTGFEVGHMMDIRKASYLKTGSANWQMAFGLLHVKGNKVVPQLVSIERDGSFIVDGKEYGA